MKWSVVSLAACIALIGAMDANAASYSQVVLSDGPIGYWRLGESSGPTAFDSSPNGLRGIYAAGVTLGQPGALKNDANTSARFDRASGHMNVGVRPKLNQLTNDFTVEAWVNVPRVTQGSSGGGTIINTRSNSLTSGYKFNASSTSGVVFTTFGRKDYIFTPRISADAWTHLVVVFDTSNDAHLYINGEFKQTITGAFPATPNDQAFMIGREPAKPTGGFVGRMDEVAIYGRSLPAEEIRNHYLVATGLPVAPAADKPDPSSQVDLLSRRGRRYVGEQLQAFAIDPDGVLSTPKPAWFSLYRTENKPFRLSGEVWLGGPSKALLFPGDLPDGFALFIREWDGLQRYQLTSRVARVKRRLDRGKKRTDITDVGSFEKPRLGQWIKFELTANWDEIRFSFDGQTAKIEGPLNMDGANKIAIAPGTKLRNLRLAVFK